MEETQSIKDKAQEFNNKMVEMKEKLDLPEKQKIVGIDLVEDISLGGDLNRKSVFVIKVQDEKGEFYHIVADKETNAIATIAKDGEIELTPREKELWEKFIGKENDQTPEQKKRYSFDKKYYLEEYKTIDKDEKEVEVKTKQKEEETKEKAENKEEEEKQQAAEALNVDTTTIIAIIKIEDRETFGQAINTKLHADAYIVKYGDNKTKVMQTTSDGKLKELAGLETSEFNSEVMEQLNIDKAGENQTIKAGDLTTIRTEDNKYNYIVVREDDSTKGIVIVNSTNETSVYTFDDEGKENVEEIQTRIQYELEEKDKHEEQKAVEENDEDKKEDEEEKEDEDEGRTPWGDAYARMRR